MKKSLLTLSLICCVSFILKAQSQDDKIKNYFEVFGGFTNPIGDFKSYDYSNNKAGFAKRGPIYGVDGVWYLHKNFGLVVLASYQDNGQPNSADGLILSDGYKASYNAYEAQTTTSKHFGVFNVMLGPQYTYVYHKFAIDLRAMAGAVKTFNTPVVSVILTNFEAAETAEFSQSSSKGLTFAYGASAGIHYNFSNSVGLALRESYLDTPTGVSVKNDARTATIKGRYVTHYPINTLQTTLGLTFSY